MSTEGRQVTEENQVALQLGACFSEMNTILGRIRRRTSGEPTAKERARLAVLKDKIVRLKRGEQVSLR